jgi:hypothetical protein
MISTNFTDIKINDDIFYLYLTLFANNIKRHALSKHHDDDRINLSKRGGGGRLDMPSDRIQFNNLACLIQL